MRNHLSVINELIEKYGYVSYLEIGVCNPKDNLDKVKAIHKVGVDPSPTNRNHPDVRVMTSDDFFAGNSHQFDLVFIDGDHRAEQVLKDIDNALACLAPKGRIVLHDVAPSSEWLQRPKSEYTPPEPWCGDGWKALYHVLNRGDVGGYVHGFDYGVGVIYKRNVKRVADIPPMHELDYNTHYAEYIQRHGK